jgi:hypothetical protein
VIVVAGVGAALLLAVAAGRNKRGLMAVAGTLAMLSLLAGPAARSATIVQRGESDSGHPGDMPARQLQALATYLAPRTRGDRYEVASAYYSTVGPLIARDGRPVLPLTSVLRQPVVPVATLVHAVRSGQVHYMLITGSCGHRSPRAIARCKPAIRWARAHSVDVSHQAGLPSGLLFRFTRLA